MAELEFVLGTAQLCQAYGVLHAEGDPPAARAQELLAAAVALGVDALDTAPSYGGAEAAIGSAPVPVPVHTKVEPGWDPVESVARSLGRLRRDRVDILYLHDATEVLRRDRPAIAAAEPLVGATVTTLGASVYEVEEFDAAVADGRIGAVQVPLSLFDRRIDADRLARAAEGGVRVYARSVLLQGVLAAPARQLTGAVSALGPWVARFEELAGDLGRSTLELAIGFVRAQAGVTGVVMGAESAAELEQLVAAARAPELAPGELVRLVALDVPPRELCDPRSWAQPA